MGIQDSNTSRVSEDSRWVSEAAARDGASPRK